MSDAGRGYDPSRIERLGRPVKHEEVYRRDYETGRTALRAFFAFYNEERPHPALGYRPPPPRCILAQPVLGQPRHGQRPFRYSPPDPKLIHNVSFSILNLTGFCPTFGEHLRALR